MFVLASHFRPAGVRDIGAVVVSPHSSCKGLFPHTTGNTREDMQAAVSHLQELARQGLQESRISIQNLIPIASCLWNCTCVPGIVQMMQRRSCMHIDMAPDIYLFLVCALSPNTNYEDVLVSFLRSSIIIFPAPRRFHRDVAWPEENAESLVIFMKACLPTLLSLYPSVVTKDVSFDARVSIFKLMRKVLLDTHDARAAFFLRNRAILRICLLEYVYYFINRVTPLPRTRYIACIDMHNLYINAFNMGQQLRMDINMEFEAVLDKENQCIQGVCDPWDSRHMEKVFIKMNDKCKVMFDRNTRSGKGIKGPMRAMTPLLNSKIAEHGNRYQHEKQLRMCVHLIHKLPPVREFVIFEACCRRQQIDSQFVQTLWRTSQALQVYELTSEIMQMQLNAIAKSSPLHSMKMRCLSSRLICMFCCQMNTFPNFRYDVRNKTYACNKCDISGSVVEVDMIGRVVFLMNTPLVLSVPDCNVVVWDGSYHVFSRQSTVPLQPQIVWDKQSMSTIFSSLVRAALPMQFIAQRHAPKPLKWPTASVEFMQARNEGETRVFVLDDKGGKRCCMCRNSTVVQRYLLLDIYNMIHVNVCVCARHAIVNKYINSTVVTVSDYLAMRRHVDS